MKQQLLGKLAPKADKRTFLLENYLMPSLPLAPTSVDWTRGLKAWGMRKNDVLGCCTVATMANQISAWTSNASYRRSPSDANVVAAYSAITGYDPRDPSTDQGAYELDVLKYWRTTGIRVGKSYDKIAAFAAVLPSDQRLVKLSIYLMGGCYLGVALPLTAQGKKFWDIVEGAGSEPGSWGGHAVNAIGYDSQSVYVVSWGKIIRVSWEFFLKYTDEAWAVFSQDWIKANGNAPNGICTATLLQDLKAL